MIGALQAVRTVQTVAVLLAAGQGSRFDPLRPGAKLDHLIDGASVGRRAFESLKPAVDVVIVAVRSAQSEIARFAQSQGATVVLPSAEFDLNSVGEGMGYSLAAAARYALKNYPKASTMLVALADMPWLLTETTRRVAEQAHRYTHNHLNTEEHYIVRPRYQNNPGHPIAFSRSLWPELCECRGDSGARGIIEHHRASLCWIDVNDAGVIRDVDVIADTRWVT
jgi:molybdenum cofactor cytidylyltransferase